MMKPSEAIKNHPIRWSIVALLAFIVAAYAVIALGFPMVRSPIIVARLRVVPLYVFLHLIGGAVAITSGAFQLNRRIRLRYPVVHRWLGRTYVIAVLVAGGAGLYLATIADGGIPSTVGFGLLAILWIASTITGYVCIRRGRVDLHRQWMFRSYGLTFAAVTLRIWLPLSMLAGLPSIPSYVAISWLCWVPNLVFVEWFVLTQKPPSRTFGAP
jgi:uncharacterized membrane protein